MPPKNKTEETQEEAQEQELQQQEDQPGAGTEAEDNDPPDEANKLMSELMGQFADDDEDEDAQAEEPSSDETEEETEEAPAEEEASEEETEETSTEEERSTEEEEEQETASSEEEVAQPDGPTPEEIQESYNRYIGEAEKLLAEQVYQMPDEELAEFEEDPQKYLPKVAARLHMQVMQAAVMNVARLLPTLMENVQQYRETSNTHEQSFFEKWPDLKEHKEAVTRIGQVYRQMNPQASAEDFIRDVGAQTSVALGLHVQQQEEKAAPRRKAPHKPAGAGAAPKATPRRETNEFSLLAEEDED